VESWVSIFPFRSSPRCELCGAFFPSSETPSLLIPTWTTPSAEVLFCPRRLLDLLASVSSISMLLPVPHLSVTIP